MKYFRKVGQARITSLCDVSSVFSPLRLEMTIARLTAIYFRERERERELHDEQKCNNATTGNEIRIVLNLHSVGQLY